MNENNKKIFKSGPEFVILREFIKTFPIEVVVINSNDDEIRKEIMDYGKYQDRVWLGKLSFWAWSNGHIVETRKLT